MRGTKERMPWITPHRFDVDDPVPIVEGDLPRVAAVDDAGVVHGDVELSEALDRGAADPSTASGSRTSTATGWTSAPSSASRSAWTARFSSSTSAMTTRMPSAAKASTMAEPDATGGAGDDRRPPHNWSIGSDGTGPSTVLAPLSIPAPPARRRWWASWSGVADSTDEIRSATGPRRVAMSAGEVGARWLRKGRIVDEKGSSWRCLSPSAICGLSSACSRFWRPSTTCSDSGRTGSTTPGSTTSSSESVPCSSWPVPPTSRSPGRPGWPSAWPCCCGSSAARPGRWRTRGQAKVPYPSFADILWLAWYPLIGLGIYYLIRVRVPQFELHRWMDGIAVTLLVLAAGFALVIQPATEHKTVGTIARRRRLRLPGPRRAAHRGGSRRLRVARLEARHDVAAHRLRHRQHVRRRCGLRGAGGPRARRRLGQQLQLHLDGRCAA